MSQLNIASNAPSTRTFVDAAGSGLSEQDKNKHVELVEFFLKRSYAHAAYMRKCPGVAAMFCNVMSWHRSIVCGNEFAHMTVDYDVYINDISWNVVHIIMCKALKAIALHEIYPPPGRIVSEMVAIESPYKVLIAAHPEMSGYLGGEGISKVLHKLWVYFYEQRHRFRSNARWVVEPTSKFNNDIVCEVRLVEGVDYRA